MTIHLRVVTQFVGDTPPMWQAFAAGWVDSRLARRQRQGFLGGPRIRVFYTGPDPGVAHDGVSVTPIGSHPRQHDGARPEDIESARKEVLSALADAFDSWCKYFNVNTTVDRNL